MECDLEKNEGIRGGLGNASIVICSIGASEKEVFDVTGPCRIDYRATKNLIDTGNLLHVAIWFLPGKTKCTIFSSCVLFISYIGGSKFDV